MKAFVCLDDKNGMLFNKRRQGRDSVLNERVLEIVANNPLYVSGYTKALFPCATIVENFSTLEAGFAFVEDPAHLQQMEIDMLYVFKWNRNYPSDTRFAMNLADYTKVSEEEFVGSSHEKISLEVYKKNGGE